MKLLPIPFGYAVVAGYFSRVLNDAARRVPGLTFNHDVKGWGGSLDAIELLLPTLPPQMRGLLEAPVAAARGASSTQDTHTLLIAEKGRRAYQLEAVHFLLNQKRCLLADAMGLGKSCSALTAARAVASRTLIVCPSYVRGVWAAEKGEITKWWPQACEILCPKGIKPSPIDDEIVVIHYDILHAWAESIAEWGPRVVIFDEIHALMNEGSQRSKAARLVANEAEYVWGLSGTPLTNRPRDLWNVADTLRPGVFGGFFAYGLRYCDAHKEAVTPTKTVWIFNGASNQQELHKRLAAFMLRRTASDVALELPPKTRQIVSVEVPQRAHLMPDGGAKAMRLSLDRAADAKVGDASALIAEHIAAGHKVVAFCWRRSVAEFLANTAAESGAAAAVIHGGVSTLQRGQRIAGAQSAKAGHLLAATIDSCSTGIDLSYADVAVFVELTYEPQELLQAEARLHRFGQTKPVLIQYIIATGTTDELIAAKVVAKLDVYETVIGATGESLGKDLKGTPEDILEELYTAVAKQVAAKKAKKKCKA